MRIQRSKLKVQNLGFTLIELLVVISIIGILAGLAMVSYSGAQKQTRDTQRRSDLNQYRNALESFASSNNAKYPSRKTRQKISNNLCRGNGTGDLEVGGFMPSCPQDPLKDTTACGSSENCNYRYVTPDGNNDGSGSATNYVLSAPLETGGWWVVCSIGKTGKVSSIPSGSSCPSGL